mmetsp:Transcript_7928/g.14926  ORF Transcript_7928/g.14926 Transcript_7928/m.14926 type:complete len:228 (+) Transcript_7928:210-893(+)|eukprot:CAMPEP_0176502704 /NCGR_PEP_ID=MMETSP0200_2-20121128/14911_1 /TAXON_ID=947934 /ORGANISM="Chaetoceros sp., Strain GSL56" /LENGTH=227 /DNA_ID=CAMNT_0017901825 /DNA_START=201 /DNA_END=884 /DNA_ORIENTATION=+
MSNRSRTLIIKFTILSFYIISILAYGERYGEVNSNDSDSKTIKKVDIASEKGHSRLLISEEESITPTAVESISSSPSERMGTNVDGQDGNDDNVTVAPSLSPHHASKSSNPSVATVPTPELSKDTLMPSSSPTSIIHTGVPTPIVQKNAKILNGNEETVEDKQRNSSRNNTILYVVFSAVVAFGLVKVVQYRRRQILMREREMVMTSQSYNSGHLDELKYVDENEII